MSRPFFSVLLHPGMLWLGLACGVSAATCDDRLLEPPAAAVTDDEVVIFTGPLTAEAVSNLIDTEHGRSARVLQITSAGGEVTAGIRLGRWIFQRGMDVRVADYCLSSCANYVFTAGRRKVIEPGAVVAWHGNYHHLGETGLWRDDVRLRMRNYGEDEDTASSRVWAQVQQLLNQEDEFFALVGVDEFLCWIGKQAPYDVPDYFFLSLPDMARFGVRGVEAAADYPSTDLSHLPVDIRFLSLEAGLPDAACQAAAAREGVGSPASSSR